MRREFRSIKIQILDSERSLMRQLLQIAVDKRRNVGHIALYAHVQIARCCGQKASQLDLTVFRLVVVADGDLNQGARFLVHPEEVEILRLVGHYTINYFLSNVRGWHDNWRGKHRIRSPSKSSSNNVHSKAKLKRLVNRSTSLAGTAISILSSCPFPSDPYNTPGIAPFLRRNRL